MRLFIALNLNDNIKTGLTKIQSAMQRQGVRGNYTKRENLHLTLAFIGEYKNPEYVLDVMHSVPLQAFTIELEGIGNFGDLYWTGIHQNDVLEAYGKRLRRALAERGVPFDRKKFSPHITLIRQAQMKNGLPHITVPDMQMEVQHISLMRSDRTKNGMIYTEIGCVSSL